MWAVAKSILKDASKSQTRIALMNLILLHNPPFERESEDILFLKRAILDLIASPVTRNNGYLLLDAITKSNPSVYINNWGTIIIGSLKNPDYCVSKHLTLRILKRLVVNFSGNPSLQEAFQRYIPEIVNLLLKTAKSDEEATNCCKVLAVCMQHLPAIVGPFSDEIESFLMDHAGSVDFKTEEGIADCFAAIPICLESRLKPKPSYTDVWVDVFLKLLNTLQALLNDFLKNSKDEDVGVSTEELLLLPTPSEDEETDEYTYVFKRIKIFSSLCKCLSKMMSVHTDSNSENLSVKVPVQDLLKCLERIFHVHDHIKANRSTENSLMNFTYPIMQISTLSVLESLVINFTIIEQSGNIVTMLSRIILTTVSENTESWAWYVRSSSWKVADAWLKNYGPKSSYDIVNNKFLISELLKDITPDQGSGHSQAPRMEKLGSGDMREECCKEALKVLSSMFIFGGAFMDKDYLNDICCTVLKVSCKVQQSSHPAKKFVYPYTNDKCRLHLYQCLLQASLSDPMQTKYVKQAINIFRFATKDPSLKVRTSCFVGLNTFRFYVNPKKPLPETLTLGGATARAVQQPPEEESVQAAGWEGGFNWNTQNDSSQEERSMDVTPPRQVEPVYHNSLGSDSRRDSHQSPHYADGLLETQQCNGSSAPKQPTSHSNDVEDSESDDVKEYSVDDAEMVDDTPAAVSTHAPIIETLKPESRPHFIELKPAQVAAEENHQENPADDRQTEEGSPLRMAENGVYAESEDEENSDEEDDEGSDEEEENNEGYTPQYAVSRYSPVSEENERSSGPAGEYYPEKKRQRMNNEEEQSSGEEYEEPPPSKLHMQEVAQEEESGDVHQHPAIHMVASLNSPTAEEMCQDFVLAEPEEIR